MNLVATMVWSYLDVSPMTTLTAKGKLQVLLTMQGLFVFSVKINKSLGRLLFLQYRYIPDKKQLVYCLFFFVCFGKAYLFWQQ